MKTSQFFDKTFATTVKSTVFADGMVINATDLQTAMLYPLELIQVLIRAYFGCGIVCGLELKKSDKPSYCVTVSQGVALDCHGFPLQLHEKVEVDLTPDPCIKPENRPKCVCIAISRATSQNAPRECGSGQVQYAREVEAVRVKAFAIPDPTEKCPTWLNNLCSCGKPGCRKEDAATTTAATDTLDRAANDTLQTVCDCLKQCGACDDPCNSEAWVLIGCVSLDECGVTGITVDCRKYVKPIACLCDRRKEVAGNTLATHVDTITAPAPPVEGTTPVADTPVGGSTSEGGVAPAGVGARRRGG